MLINNKKFNQISFFLSGNVEVKDLRTGAVAHGGATLFNGIPYSNIEGSSYFTVNEGKENIIRILVPTTINVDQQINNKSFVDKYLSIVKNSYNFKNIKTYNTTGSWYSEDLQKVVFDNSTVIEISMKKIDDHIINYFLNLGLKIKSDMTQEGVSVFINKSLAIV